MEIERYSWIQEGRKEFDTFIEKGSGYSEKGVRYRQLERGSCMDDY